MQENGSGSSSDEEGYFHADSDEITNADLDLNFNEDEMIQISKLIFDEEAYKLMLQKTYESYYPKQYVVPSFQEKETMKLIKNENLVERYKPYMANKRENVLTLKTAP